VDCSSLGALYIWHRIVAAPGHTEQPLREQLEGRPIGDDVPIGQYGGMAMCYNSAWKHEPITLYVDDVE
jgi:hypothetical protein